MKNKKLILFNNYYSYIENNVHKELTYEELAKNYFKWIKNILPNSKKYNFVGWSFGGVLAFEVIRQFNLLGNLTLIDPYFNLRKVVERNYIKLNRNNINYKYRQFLIRNNVSITLFKANRSSRISLQDDSFRQKENAYLKTEDNNISDYILNKKILDIRYIEASHMDWINSVEIIKNIAKRIIKTYES